MAGLVSSNTVAPGETGRLDVRIDPIGKKGKVTKTVAVYSDDAAEPKQILQVKADVRHGTRSASGLRMEKVLFSARCKSCHADAGRGQKGKTLYEAICAFCHGVRGEGVSTHPLREGTDAWARNWIAVGKPGTAMAGYSKKQGGPLEAAQIESLVDHIKSLSRRRD